MNYYSEYELTNALKKQSLLSLKLIVLAVLFTPSALLLFVIYWYFKFGQVNSQPDWESRELYLKYDNMLSSFSMFNKKDQGDVGDCKKDYKKVFSKASKKVKKKALRKENWKLPVICLNLIIQLRTSALLPA